MNATNLPQKLIAVFISTHETLTAEKFLNKEKLPFRPVLKPRGISSHCQMGLQIDTKHLTKFIGIAKQNQLGLSGVYTKNEEDGWEKVEI